MCHFDVIVLQQDGPQAPPSSLQRAKGTRVPAKGDRSPRQRGDRRLLAQTLREEAQGAVHGLQRGRRLFRVRRRPGGGRGSAWADVRLHLRDDEVHRARERD